MVYLSLSVLVQASKLTEWVSAGWKKIVEASFRSQESNDCGERQAVLANKHSLAIFGEQTSIADQLCITEVPHSTQQMRLLVLLRILERNAVSPIILMIGGRGGGSVLFGKLPDDFWMAK